MMARLRHICGAVACLLILISTSVAQQGAELLLQQGLYEEEIAGRLENAIQIYETIIRDFADQRPTAARAQLQVGICYEKMGLQKAQQAYQKVVDEFPDQPDVVAAARVRLRRFEKPEIDPLVRYYFDRICPDPMRSVSYDGKYLAYTDWTSGNLMIRNRAAGETRKLTNVDWAETKEFAYHPAWSRDGKHIAYSWYRGLNFIELRVVSVSTKESWVVYSDSARIIFPHDWASNGKGILCEVFKDLYSLPKSEHYVALISLDGKLEPVTTLGVHSRGLKLSPDGRLVAYDLRIQGNRHIVVYRIEDDQQIQITSGRSLDRGFDSPAWSSDGKLLLYRSNRRSRYDLWAVPFADGGPSGNSYIVETNIMGKLLSIKGIDEKGMTGISQSTTRHEKRGVADNTRAFTEEFSSATLNDAWNVCEWKGENVYGNSSFGRYSLTEHPGHLRYYVDAMMGPGYPNDYLPGFDDWWYWGYPGLEISRPLLGDRWLLETRVTFSMVYGVNTRSLGLRIFLNPEKEMGSGIYLGRENSGDMSTVNISLGVGNSNIARHTINLSALDTTEVTDVTYSLRITRLDTFINVEISEDDRTYRSVINGKIPSEFCDRQQELMITGHSWFVPAGSYADWDYFRFRPLDEAQTRELK